MTFLLTMSPNEAIAAQTPPPDQSPVKTNYPGGEVGNYRRELLVFVQRSHAISDELASIRIQTSYCSSELRTAHGQVIGAVRVRADAFIVDYDAFKFKWRKMLDNQAAAKQFADAGYPNSKNFFDAADKEIVDHLNADIASARAAWMASYVEDCNAPRQRAVEVQPPQRTQTPRRDPLAGFTRPAVPIHAAVPPLPPPFCSYTALWDWHDANLLPQMKGYLDAIWKLRTYSQQIGEASKAPYEARDTASLRVLHAEKKWADDAHVALDAYYWELARLRDQLTVIDCTPPKPPEEPKTAIEEKTGLNWRVGVGLEYAGFSDFKNVVGDQRYSTGVDGKGNTTGFGVSVGVDTKRLACSLSGHYNSLSYEQSYNPPEINLARQSTGAVDGQFYDASCGPHWNIWGLDFGGFVGMTYAMNRLTLVDRFSNGALITTNRSLTNWKSNFGVTLEIPVRSRFGLRFDLTNTLGGWSGDADRNTRFGVGFGYRADFHRF